MVDLINKSFCDDDHGGILMFFYNRLEALVRKGLRL
ncbi:hypothetical protein VPH1254_0066 [Vibrio phage 1254]